MVQRIYIWEFPVRLVHWVNFLSILVLSFTGIYIGSPFLFVPPGEHFVFTTVKFIHMVAAYVFTVSCLIRLYWAFVGNEHGRVRVFFPFTRKRWKEVIEYMKFYLFMRKTLAYAPGHTASAALAYLGLFLLYLVEIVSGFSLYSQSHHGFLWTVMGGWLLSYISGPTLRLIHHFVMWLIFAFVILHLYIAWVNEIVGKDFVISSIFGGYKTPHEE